MRGSGGGRGGAGAGAVLPVPADNELLLCRSLCLCCLVVNDITNFTASVLDLTHTDIERCTFIISLLRDASYLSAQSRAICVLMFWFC